jgi:hypothetical protein
VREEFSPLLYHLFADYIAARLGRSLFQDDRPELLQSVEEYYASLQQGPALGEPVAVLSLTQERPLYWRDRQTAASWE